MTMKRNIYRLVAAVFAAVLILALASCGSHRPTTVAGGTYGEVSLDECFGNLAASYTPWNTMSAPLKIEISNPVRFSASGKAEMVKGQCISMVFRKIGIKVAELYVDPDSVMFVVKPLKIAYTESFARFSNRTGLTMDDLQSALLGQAFVPGRGTVAAGSLSEFTLAAADGGAAGEEVVRWTMTPRRSSDEIYFTAVTPLPAGSAASRLEAVGVNVAGGVQFEYTDFASTGAGQIGSRVSLEATFGGKTLAGNLRWTADRADWNQPMTVGRPSIPADYRRLDTAGMLRIIQNTLR